MNAWNPITVSKLFYQIEILDIQKLCAKILKKWWSGVVANVLDSNIVVSEFKLQSLYYIYLRTNTLGKGMDPSSSSYGLNCITYILLQGWIWH